MQAMKTTRLAIELQKTILNGTLETMALFQDQVIEFNDCWTRKIGVSPQINASFEQWQAMFRKGRADLKRYIDTQFSTIEGICSAAENGRGVGACEPSATHSGAVKASGSQPAR
jgi:hypothetical protein